MEYVALNKILREFLACYLRSRKFVEWATLRSLGISKPRIRPNDLLSAQVQLPLLEQQRKIAEFLQNLQEKILKLKEHHKQILSMLEELKSSILNKVFQLQ